MYPIKWSSEPKPLRFGPKSSLSSFKVIIQVSLELEGPQMGLKASQIEVDPSRKNQLG